MLCYKLGIYIYNCLKFELYEFNIVSYSGVQVCIIDASNSKMVVVTTLLEDPVFYHRGYDKKETLGLEQNR